MGQATSNFNEVLGEVKLTESGKLAESTWQSASDRPYRIGMIHRLLDMLVKKLYQAVPKKQLTEIARLLELALYRRANSLDEFLNTATLGKRLEYLALVGCPPATRFENYGLMRGLSEKRSKKRRNSDASVGAIKRICTRLNSQSNGTQSDCPQVNVKQMTSKELNPCFDLGMSSSLLFGNREDIIFNVFSFLDGKKVLQCCQLNWVAYKYLPRCVVSIRMNIEQLSTVLNMHPQLGGGLRRCSQLESICIVNHDNDKMNSNQAAFVGKDCEQCFCCSQKNAESIIQNLAECLAQGLFHKLERLFLHGVFFNSIKINATRAFTTALSKGCCPNLRCLSIIGNGIGDSGAVDVADLIASGGCPQLRHIDLRKNYIGEKGISAITKTCHGVKLKNLCLGGNIITNAGARNIAEAFKQNSFSELEYIGLDSNFIEGAGVREITSALESGNGFKLKQLNLHGNETGNLGAFSLSNLIKSRKCPQLQYVDAGNIQFYGAFSILQMICQSPVTPHLNYVVVVDEE